MGASQSNLAEKHAMKGWPAFMTQSQMKAQATKFRMSTSLLGRIKLYDKTGGCIEYVTLDVGPQKWGGRGKQTFYFANSTYVRVGTVNLPTLIGSQTQLQLGSGGNQYMVANANDHLSAEGRCRSMPGMDVGTFFQRSSRGCSARVAGTSTAIVSSRL